MAHRKRPRSRDGKAAAKAGAAKRRKSDRPILSDADIAKAAARASTSLTSSLREDSRLFADDLVDEAIDEAEELGLMLDGDEDEDENNVSEDDAYFLKAPRQGPPHPRGRPAADIVAEPARAGARAGAAPPPLDARHLFPRNLKLDYPVAVRAKGIWIEDSSGRRYLDGCGGAVVCSIGHGVPEIADIMSAQAERLAFAHSSQFISREAAGLAARIAALAPGDMKKSGRVYLVSGGSEAVETAIKLARQYQIESGRPGKSKIISRWQSYHGSTMGALSVTGNVARRELYMPMFTAMPHIEPCYCYRCPFGLKYPSCDIACIEELESTIRQEGPDSVAAFIAEPIVGATLGAVPAVDGYWKRAREICTQHDILLIADEVMTGIGRTGKNFAVDHHRVVPDLIVTGKGLSAGYAPLGAVIARDAVTKALERGRGYFEHGFTYSANPLSAAIGTAVLDYIREHRLVSRAARVGRVLGRKLKAAMRRHAIVGDVRGAGMMWGVELVRDRKSREPFPPQLKVARKLYEACFAEGLLIYPGAGTRQGQDGDHFIIAPPFTVTLPEIDELLARLDRGLKAVRRKLV